MSSLHGKNEREENIVIAKYFAEKYNEKIDLLKNHHNKSSADAFNHSKNEFQEYKTNKKPTKSAIDNELRKGANQSKHIIIHINSEISDDNLLRGIKGRVTQKMNIEKITIIRNNQDKTYLREEIMQKGFKL
ncbi:MAG TPA: hypothetical protein P5243_04390 [Bacteroidales bacterium]|nr:hypothetical protein [Bacteroidales bacterium]HRS18720.1 hypothetical protein [Bacteroidales bacterium]